MVQVIKAKLVEKLNLKLGFPHDVEMLVPEEVVVEMPNQLEIILTSFKEAFSFTIKYCVVVS